MSDLPAPYHLSPEAPGTEPPGFDSHAAPAEAAGLSQLERPPAAERQALATSARVLAGRALGASDKAWRTYRALATPAATLLLLRELAEATTRAEAAEGLGAELTCLRLELAGAETQATFHRLARKKAQMEAQMHFDRAEDLEAQVAGLRRELGEAHHDGWVSREMLASSEKARLLYPVGMDYENMQEFSFAQWLRKASAAPEPLPQPEQRGGGVGGPACWCQQCRNAYADTLTGMEKFRFHGSQMVVCPDCGNKRCPRANFHENACTGSNAVGQPGSSWENVKPFAERGLPDGVKFPDGYLTYPPNYG